MYPHKKFRLFTFYVFLFITFSKSALSQNLKKTNDDHQISDIFISLLDSSKIYENNDFYKASSFLKEAQNYVQKTDHNGFQTKLWIQYGRLFMKMGLMDLSADSYIKAIKNIEDSILTEHDDLMASKIGLAGVYLYLYQFSKAEEILSEALDFLQNNDSQDYLSYSSIYNNFGIIYREQGDLVRAYDNLNLGLQLLLSKDPNNKNLPLLQNNLGDVYLRMNNYEQALDLYHAALELRSSADDQLGIAVTHKNIGILWEKAGDKAQSLYHHKVALGIAENIDALIVQQITSFHLSNLYRILGKSDSALYYYDLKPKLDGKIKKAEAEKLLLVEELKRDFEQSQQQLLGLTASKIKVYLFWLVFLSILMAFLIYFLFIFRRKNKQISLEMIQAKLQNEMEALDKQYLQSQIDERDRQITANMIYAIKRNELIQAALDKLLKHRKEFDKAGQETIRGVIHDLKNTREDHIFEEFEASFINLHQEFYDNLLQKFPHLTLNEKRLCAFIKLNMTTKEIATVTGQTVPTLNKAKQRLRKKFDLIHSGQDIYDFIGKIV